MKSIIQFLQFGSPTVQKTYKNLCEIIGMNFDEFQDKLIEDTGFSYNQLKEFLTYGKDKVLTEDEFNELEENQVENYLIIHFDIDNKEVLGIVNKNYDCLTDGYFYYEEECLPPNPLSIVYRKNL